MESTYAKALRKREELRSALADVEQFLALHRRLFGTELEHKDVLISEDRDSRAAPMMRESPDLPPPTRRRRANTADFADMAERILRDEKRPMSRTELVAAFEARNVTLPSEDKARYLGTILWRHRDRFANIPGEGYYVQGMEMRAANGVVGKTVFATTDQPPPPDLDPEALDEDGTSDDPGEHTARTGLNY